MKSILSGQETVNIGKKGPYNPMTRMAYLSFWVLFVY